MFNIVSIIYVNYNTSDELLSSLKSVAETCSNIGYEVIIVDNNSTELERYRLSNGIADLSGKENVRLILSGENVGFGRANNLGAQYATGRYLLFLNPDTIVLNDIVAIFYNFLESSDAGTAACGGNLLTKDYSPNYSYGNFPSLLYEVCSIGFGLRLLFPKYYLDKVFIGKKIEDGQVHEAPYIVGADIFIKKNVFEELYGFDEEFFMYYEETDLFFRLNRRGYKSFVLPTAKIIHFEGGAIAKTAERKFNYNKAKLVFKSKLYYFSKWYPKYRQVLILTMFCQVIVQFAKGKMGASVRKIFSCFLSAISDKNHSGPYSHTDPL